MRKWILLMVLFMAGCDGIITSGEVVNKCFVPAHQETTMTPTLDFDGNMTVTTDTVNVPDQWFVVFEKVDEDNRLKQRTVAVDLETYNRFNVGDWIAFDSGE
jgi:hypothetical protein